MSHSLAFAVAFTLSFALVLAFAFVFALVLDTAKESSCRIHVRARALIHLLQN